MGGFKQLQCWLTRHHWQLQFTVPVTVYETNELPRDEKYCYQCQRCSLWDVADIINLNNAPEVSNGSG